MTSCKPPREHCWHPEREANSYWDCCAKHGVWADLGLRGEVIDFFGLLKHLIVHSRRASILKCCWCYDTKLVGT